MLAELTGLTVADLDVKDGKTNDTDSGIGRTISNSTKESTSAAASVSRFSEVNHNKIPRIIHCTYTYSFSST